MQRVAQPGPQHPCLSVPQGELTITTDMEDLSTALFYDTVPDAWTARAYPSMMGLAAWHTDLLLRIRVRMGSPASAHPPLPRARRSVLRGGVSTPTDADNAGPSSLRGPAVPTPCLRRGDWGAVAQAAAAAPSAVRPWCLAETPLLAGAGGLDHRLRPAHHRVAGRLLQPPVLPHGHHAVHGQEERVAAGQDVPLGGGDQEEPRGRDGAPARGLLRVRALHGR